MNTNITLEYFLTIYPEFTDLVDNKTLQAMVMRMYVLYLVLNNGETERERIATCMVVAHYLASSSNQSSSEGGINGVVASASIGGGVSVTMQTAPTKDNFEYFFSSTKYGLEFLTWLSGLGFDYVN